MEYSGYRAHYEEMVKLVGVQNAAIMQTCTVLARQLLREDGAPDAMPSVQALRMMEMAYRVGLLVGAERPKYARFVLAGNAGVDRKDADEMVRWVTKEVAPIGVDA